MRREGVRVLFHLGDLMDRRKFVNFKTAETVRKEFLERCAWDRIETHIIAGNHDVMYKNTNEVNSLRELVGNRYGEGVRIYTNTPANVHGVMLVPWINPENHDTSMQMVDEARVKTCLGHFEFKGFKHYKNTPEAHEGMDPGLFNKFGFVGSGHYHHKSSKGNVHYLGSPYELYWSDHDDPRGFHILDTETHELTFVQNPFALHQKVLYDESAPDGFDPESCRDRIVKVIARNRTDSNAFDAFIKTLDGVGADVQVVEDHLHQDVILPEEMGALDVDDTPDILAGIAGEDADLKGLLLNTYQEAMSRR